MKNNAKLIGFIAILITLLVAGCVQQGEQQTMEENTQQTQQQQQQEQTQPTPQDTSAQQAEATTPAEDTGSKNRIVVLETTKGTIKFELYEKRAPITTTNFIKLVSSGFYDGLKFHRVEPNFVVQGGDPLGTGMGGSDETIKLEIHPELRHVKGALGMARSADRDSASSQFYFTLEDSHFLDDNYAVFGQVTVGMDVISSLVIGDVMTKVYLEE